MSASVCGMNSQNIYWRIESLHQRTLIGILYEFFILVFMYIHVIVNSKSYRKGVDQKTVFYMV